MNLRRGKFLFTESPARLDYRWAMSCCRNQRICNLHPTAKHWTSNLKLKPSTAAKNELQAGKERMRANLTDEALSLFDAYDPAQDVKACSAIGVREC